MTIIGDRQVSAKALKPALKNSYMARPNKRKSNIALPLFSCVYVEKLFVIYLACEFSVAVSPN